MGYLETAKAASIAANPANGILDSTSSSPLI